MYHGRRYVEAIGKWQPGQQTGVEDLGGFVGGEEDTSCENVSEQPLNMAQSLACKSPAGSVATMTLPTP